MKHITKYKVFESESHNDEIDFDMINDAKDMALDFLDEGYTLEIDVYYGIIENTVNVDKRRYDPNPHTRAIIYRLKYSHEEEKASFSHKWYKQIGNCNLIMYYFIIYKGEGGEYTEDSDKSFEIVSRIMEAYPNKYKYATKTKNYPTHIYIDNILYRELK